MRYSRWGRGFRRCTGLVLFALVVFPVYRLLAYGNVGIIEADIMQAADQARALLLSGGLTAVLLTAILTILLARLISLDAIEGFLGSIGHRMAVVPRVPFACSLAMLGCVLTAVCSHVILADTPNLMDSIAQLLHARYFAAGQLTAPVGVWSPFVVVQNSLTLPTGWASQYPPGHVALLAIGFLVHAVWLVGPMLFGITVFFTTLVADRLLPEDGGVARIGAVLTALSPFAIGLASAYMNHISAAAGMTAAVYCALRSRDDESLWWAVLTGVALGVVFTIRPLTAVTAGLVVTVLWLDTWDRHSTWPAVARATVCKLGASFVGALPFGIAVLVYDARVFGHPLRIGYMAANGPGMRLGFHLDPWGNWYGPLQALAYTSSDLTTLSLNLLETPLPAVVICAVYLITARPLTPSIRTIVLWALAPVVANALYWHHGIFMGPRMLNEVTPAWILFTTVSTVGLVRAIPRECAVGPYLLRPAAVLLVMLGLLSGLVYLAPQRLRSYRTASAIPAATFQSASPTLVFVHGAWTARVAMRLIAAGMRLDSVETVLRQNSTCVADAFAKLYLQASSEQRQGLIRTVDFTPAPARSFENANAAPGTRIRVVAGERLTPECSQEFLADRGGVIDASVMAWAYDLPGLGTRGPMLVRDMGPVENAKLIRLWPARRPMVLYSPTPAAEPRLAPYDVGIATVWNQ